ncbi:MAG: hypothetical protein H6834_12150 [Planctomycetes bacterium]|nr:hypothetical protein [Planctomycetota bacterium]
MKHTNFLIVCASLASAPLAAQGTWTQQNPAQKPSVRAEHQMASTADSVLLFAGAEDNGGPRYADLWEWRNGAWTRLSPGTSPSVRGGHAMSYDPVREVLVVHSGWNGNVYPTDTWEFDGQVWTNPQVTSPSGRDWHAMAFDPVNQTTVLFGGHDWVRSTQGLGAWDDFWSWDGTTWTQLQPGTLPPAAFGCVMATDFARHRVVLFGGTSATTDVWEWDGATWTQIQPTSGPIARNWPSMAWDPTRQRVVLHGGRDTAQNLLDDTWEWDGTAWTQIGSMGPARVWSALAYDPSSFELMLFGGAIVPDRTVTDDLTWTFRAPGAWEELGNGLAGTAGVPFLSPTGLLRGGDRLTLTCRGAAPAAPALLVLGTFPVNIPLLGGTLVPSPDSILTGLSTNALGEWVLTSVIPGGTPPGFSMYAQSWILDAGAPQGLAASNAIRGETL